MSAALVCMLGGALCAGAATLPTPPRARCLVEAYSEHICAVRGNIVFWCDGGLMAWDNGRSYRDHDELLDHADLQDQLAQTYPLGRDYPIPLPENFEPGRIRHTPFFLRMYGGSARQVRDSLVEVAWLPEHVDRTLRVSSVNGIDRRLAAVSREIEALPAPIRRHAEPTSGTFNWRSIKGTSRRSLHSFAVAVDVGVPSADYWRWNRPGPDGAIPYKNRMPLEIVEIFERHGFVWGGKWYHYDTMHFEYRPELILCAEAGGAP